MFTRERNQTGVPATGRRRAGHAAATASTAGTDEEAATADEDIPRPSVSTGLPADRLLSHRPRPRKKKKR